MLDLVEAVVERVHGAVLFVCLARPEFLEQRTAWAAGKARAVTMTLPPLSFEDTRRVAEHLLGDGAPASIVDRVCGTAEGNPLYLEQLTAMLADQGLLIDGTWTGAADAELEIPSTLKALVTARLDRLDPVSRLVLERASVEGRRFRIAVVRALAPDLPAAEISAAMDALDRSGLAQPEDEAEGRWRFAHALLLDAAYGSLSKAQRAEFHEQLAEWMMREDSERSELEESVARHLERALHLREELHLRDERSSEMSSRAGDLFATAGSRAFARLDFITSRDLLGRAAALLAACDPRRLEMLPSLGVALTETGRAEESQTLLSSAVEQSRAVGAERDALRATVQLLANQVYRTPTDAEIGAAVAEAESLSRSCVTWATTWASPRPPSRWNISSSPVVTSHGPHGWTFVALRHGLAAGRVRESMQGSADAVGMAFFGPLPFDRFAPMVDERSLLNGEPISTSTGHALLAIGALAAGDEGGFGEHERRWRDIIGRNGLSWLGATHALIIGHVEAWVGASGQAERRLREARDTLMALGDVWWVASLDCAIAATLTAQGRDQEFLRLAEAFDVAPPVNDRDVLIRRTLVRARALLLRGSAADAEAAARRGLALAGSADLELDHAEALLTLADVLRARGLDVDAAAAHDLALERLRTKGALAAVAILEG